jgi:hypothetical protein
MSIGLTGCLDDMWLEGRPAQALPTRDLSTSSRALPTTSQAVQTEHAPADSERALNHPAGTPRPMRWHAHDQEVRQTLSLPDPAPTHPSTSQYRDARHPPATTTHHLDNAKTPPPVTQRLDDACRLFVPIQVVRSFSRSVVASAVRHPSVCCIRAIRLVSAARSFSFSSHLVACRRVSRPRGSLARCPYVPSW